MDEKSLERHRGYDWLRADLQKILIDLQAFCEARYGSL
jgi:hypothetical protein